jgi:hypothetical protein
MAEIGKPLRKVVVIPVEHPITAPEGPRREAAPDKVPEKQPEKVPADAEYDR